MFVVLGIGELVSGGRKVFLGLGIFFCQHGFLAQGGEWTLHCTWWKLDIFEV